jgi:hypothetical protein
MWLTPPDQSGAGEWVDVEPVSSDALGIFGLEFPPARTALVIALDP